MPNKVINEYEITYLDHKVPVVQRKYLINHDDFIQVIQPIQSIIAKLERENEEKPNKPTKESSELKTILFDLFGELYFTDQSPLYSSMKTGKLELRGKLYRVQFKKIKNDNKLTT